MFIVYFFALSVWNIKVTACNRILAHHILLSVLLLGYLSFSSLVNGVLFLHKRNMFSTALNQMGYRVSPAFATIVVMRYDPHARSQIGLDNFIQSCVLLKSITDTFRQKDTTGSGTVNISYEEFLTMVMLNKP